MTTYALIATFLLGYFFCIASLVVLVANLDARKERKAQKEFEKAIEKALSITKETPVKK